MPTWLPCPCLALSLAGLLLSTSVRASTTDTVETAHEADGKTASVDGAVFRPPELLSQPSLVHPLSDDEARALGEAAVEVLLEVDEDGVVVSATIEPTRSIGHPALRQAAMSAAVSTRFRPATREGRPAAVRVPLTLVFTPPPVGARIVDASHDATDAAHVDAVHEKQRAPDAVDGARGETETTPVDARGHGASDDDDESDGEGSFSKSDIGSSTAIAGALLFGTSLVVALFSGVSAIDGAARLEEVHADDEGRLAEASTLRTHGTLFLFPGFGPFAAAPFAADSTTTLMAIAIGVGQLVGLASIALGATLITIDFVADE